jgi:Tfp pilus assembly protein PilO
VNAAGYFTKIGKRENILLGALLAVLFVSLAYRIFGESYFSEQKSFKGSLQKILDETASRKAKFPDIKTQEKEIGKLRQDYDSVLKQIEDLESKIPAAGSVSQLLGEVTRRAEGLGMDFESIQQNIEREKEGYLKLKLGIKLSAPYSSVVNYLSRLQNLSEYLTVEDIEIAQAKEGVARSKTDLELSMLLLEKGIDLTLREKEAAFTPLVIKTDPFTSKRAGSSADKVKGLKLVGITSAGKDSTAIINDEVIKIGGQVGDWKVVQILPDAVTLSDGVETVSITLNR